MKTYAFRLLKGQDVKKEIVQFVIDNKIRAGVIITAVGSVSKVVIRMAGASPEKSDLRTFEEKLEIVSLVGTISQKDSHIHIALSNTEGKVIGGHLKGEAIVDTTAEIILGDLEDMIFTTETDETTGYKELKVINRIDN
jgi:predicted DNA-binding protein with PD1-like motif